MVKKLACVLLSLSLLFPLAGCWSYIGLNEITIVAGVGIDYDSKTGNFNLTCEVIDLSASNKLTGTKAKIVESTGKTIFDAVRNAKRRLISKLYWGNAQVLVLGQELAEQGKVNDAVDWFLSDAECRETIAVAISQEKTAKDVLTIYGLDNAVVSYEIKKIIDDDQTDTSSLKSVPLYQLYSKLRSPGVSVTLPAFRVVENDGKPSVEGNGVAVFKDEKLVGFLSALDTKYFLFATDGVSGGILTFSSDGQKDNDVSLEISDNRTNTSYSYSGGKIKITIETDTDVYLEQLKTHTDMTNEKYIAKLEGQAQDMVKEEITRVIKKIQTEYDSDIFAFGNIIYKKDPKLWGQLEPQWDKMFQSLQVEVKSKVHILNSAFLKSN